MTHFLSRLPAATAIGCLGLAATIAAIYFFALRSEQSDLKTPANFDVQVQDTASTGLYSGTESVSDQIGIVSLSYHKLDGTWDFQKVVGVALSRTKNIPAPDGGTNPWQKLSFKDGSFKLVALRDDGKGRLSSQSFFALPEGDDERDGRHLQSSVKYAEDGKTIVDSEVLWYSGKEQQLTHLEPNGRLHIISYAEDGETVTGDQWFAKPEQKGTPAVIESEKRWLDNAQHTLSYRDEQNADGTRTIVDCNEDSKVLWEAHWTKGDIVYGTTVDGYYPLTGKLRYHSESGFESDEVVYYREDGTVSARLSIGHQTTQISYYDESGTKLRLSQMFERRDTPDLNLDHASYQLMLVMEYDEAGKQTLYASFTGDRLSHLERANDTIDGVQYGKVVYFLGVQGLARVIYWNDPNKIDGDPDRIDEHPKQIKVEAKILPDERNLQLHFGDDVLPVPPLRRDDPGS